MDAKLEKVLRLYRSTTHAGEEANARKIAEELLAGSGMTFAEALETLDAPKRAPNIFAGFDDWMEEREPGHKARCAAKRAERKRQFAERRAAVIRLYGSVEAAEAPTMAEQAMFDALAPWRVVGPDGYTEEIRGHVDCEPLPDHLAEVVRNAMPWPTTYSEAVAEHEMWSKRKAEIESLAEDYLEYPLDLAPHLRAEMIEDQVNHIMPGRTAAEIHDRMRRYRKYDSTWRTEMLDAVERDLAALAQAEAHQTASVHKPEPTLDDVLKADPSRSDRDIARQMGCSPTTVGKARVRLGLDVGERSVQRGGQMYRMKRRGPSSTSSMDINPR